MDKYNKMLPFDELREIFSYFVGMEICGLDEFDVEVCNYYDVVKSDNTKHEMVDNVFNVLRDSAEKIFKGFIQEMVTIEVDTSYEQTEYPYINSVDLVYGD